MAELAVDLSFACYGIGANMMGWHLLNNKEGDKNFTFEGTLLRTAGTAATSVSIAKILMNYSSPSNALLAIGTCLALPSAYSFSKTKQPLEFWTGVTGAAAIAGGIAMRYHA